MPKTSSFRCLEAVLADGTHAPELASQSSSPVSASSCSVEPTQAGEPLAASGGQRLRQLFRKKTPSPKPVPDRDSFFCGDARAIEEAFASCRDRYAGAALTPGSPEAHEEARAHFRRAAPPEFAEPQSPSRSLMAEAWAQRAQQAAQASPFVVPPQALGVGAAGRPSHRRCGQTQAPPPPVPPLPEQYRVRAVTQRI